MQPKLKIESLTLAMNERMLETNEPAFVRPVPLKMIVPLFPIVRRLQEIVSGAPRTECGQATTAEPQRQTALPRKRIGEHPQGETALEEAESRPVARAQPSEMCRAVGGT